LVIGAWLDTISGFEFTQDPRSLLTPIRPELMPGPGHISAGNRDARYPETRTFRHRPGLSGSWRSSLSEPLLARSHKSWLLNPLTPSWSVGYRRATRAFDLLVLKYQHKIVNLVMRYVRDPDQALDISQEAFLKAYRALPRFRGDSAFYTWLYRIAVNTAKNHLAAARRRPMDVELDLQDPEQYDLHAKLKETDTPEGVTLSNELHETVERAIEALPEDLRTAIVLRELDGMSYEEIAQTMDCPVGTVRSRIFRARDAIGKKIGNLID
jgi:RNA polymerase sigma-70 factor (ECF subfamily)